MVVSKTKISNIDELCQKIFIHYFGVLPGYEWNQSVLIPNKDVFLLPIEFLSDKKLRFFFGFVGLQEKIYSHNFCQWSYI